MTLLQLIFALAFVLHSTPNTIGQRTSNPIQSAIVEIRNHEFAIAQRILIGMVNYTEAISEIVESVYDNSEQNINLILDLASNISKVQMNRLILTSLWNEMKKNHHRNPYHLMALYKSLNNEVCSQVENEKFCENDKTMKDEIKSENENSVREILKSYMISNNFQHNPDVRNLTNAIYEFENAISSDRVILKLVTETFSLLPAVQIADSLMNGCAKLTQTISGLLLLSMKLNAENDINNPAVLRISSHFKKIKSMEAYADISMSHKYVINILIDRLPICAKSLHFHNEVCIANRGKGEYLFASGTKFFNNMRRAVFTVDIDQIENNGTWRVYTNSDGTFFFRNQDYRNEYLYASPVDKYDSMKRNIQTINFKSSQEQRNAVWTVELLGDYCFIKNFYSNEYLYAADEKDSENSTFVFSSRHHEGYGENADFLWQIQDCN